MPPTSEFPFTIHIKMLPKQLPFPVEILANRGISFLKQIIAAFWLGMRYNQHKQITD
jgi:hypothetical protein